MNIVSILNKHFTAFVREYEPLLDTKEHLDASSDIRFEHVESTIIEIELHYGETPESLYDLVEEALIKYASTQWTPESLEQFIELNASRIHNYLIKHTKD